ncbi:MAG: cation:proton antiporter [Firmicutes bacterium]|nr:cation:proton antiporter [Bacillota bacterium]MCM1476370.1 cation:proton antiporter [Bacteroides sp.]
MAIPAVHPLVTSPVLIFLIVLAIILFVPVVLGRLKIPHVIGMIIAGIVVGPYGFSVLARDMSFEVFGQVGILYLMFLAGVEIDMYHLKRNLRRGMVFGLFTFFVPLVLGSVASVIFLGADMLKAILLASMFSAHTLLAYPIVSRFGLTTNRAVVIAVAGTIFTVLGSLLVLAGTVGVARTGRFDGLTILRLLGGLLLYCVLIVYLYPRITRWFFKRHNDNIAQFVYILAMVFLAAETAAWIGLEGVFGAFLAGIVLNRFIPARSPLMGRIEFVGNALFIPYFLIGVGMMINVRALFAGWDSLYVAGVMSATAMAGKWLAAFLTQRTFRMPVLERSIMYQLSNAHTAVALAVVTIGFKIGIFNETVLDGTVVMILVTCTVSSIGTARAAQRLKVVTMSNTPIVDEEEQRKRSRVVNTLIPVVNPLSATELVSLAMMMHDVRPGGHNHFYALHVRNDNSASSRAVGRNSLDVAEQTAASMDVPLQTIDRYDLNFVTGVLNTMEERDINEVVIGLHRRTAVIDSFFGEKLTRLLRSTYRMVVISRCYIPVNTMRRLVVVVPDKAEYETGFVRWVKCIGNLGRQLGCRGVFFCSESTRQYIETVLRRGGYGFRHSYRLMDTWDDFVLLANKIIDDDLFVVVTSRTASVSYDPGMASLPEFLSKYFVNNNMIVIYPEQFGAEAVAPVMGDAISADVEAMPSGLWLKMLQYSKALHMRLRRIIKPNKRNSDI